LALAAGAIAVPTAASAQAADDADAGASGGDIIVTAQRRSELLEEVPMAVQVITPDAVSNSGVTNFMELGKIAVGAQMAFNGSVPAVAIRGITSALSAYNAEPNVAVYVDGFYDGQPLTIAADLSNLESVQILKGPQGTLYGRNATGGAMLITTLGPTHVLTAKSDISFERFDRVTFNGYVAGPLSDKIRVSLSGHLRQGDLSMRLADRNVVGGTAGSADTFKQANIRAKLEMDLSDELTATLGYSHSYVNDPRANFFSVYDHILPPPNYVSPPLRPTRFGVAAYQFPNFSGGKSDQYSLKLAWETPLGTLSSFTGYSDRFVGVNVDFGGAFVPIFDIRTRYDQKTFQQSIDYNITAIDRLQLNIGGLYYDDQLTQKGDSATVNISQGVPATIVRQNSYTKAWALYADATYSLTDRLNINVGGRYSYDKKRATYQQNLASGAVLTPFISDTTSWKEFTPRATIRYEVAPRTNVYASVTRGFRAGLYSQQGPAGGVYDPAQPEKITAYEVGFKTAGRKFRLSAAAFYYDYTDLQVTITLSKPGEPVSSILQNSKGAKVKGFETEFSYNPIPNLTLRGGISVLDAYYVDFPNAVGTGVNATNTLNVSNQQQDLSGHELVRAPNYSGSAGFDYEIPSSVGTFLLTSTLSFTDSYVVSNPSVYGPLAPAALRDKQRLRQKAYQLLSAQVRWTDPSDHLSLALFGDNLTNTSYRLSYNAGSFGDYSAKADPRTYGVRLGYKF
jgi:iron complex outermembrane receptor protein